VESWLSDGGGPNRRVDQRAGHDLVAAFGYQQDNQGKSNGDLTVVASTHPYNGRLNFIQGQTGTVLSWPRLIGTLTRTRPGRWTVQTAASSEAFAVTRLWQTAFGSGKPWLYSDGTGDQAAMRYIAGHL
jgi:hypothetical protein